MADTEEYERSIANLKRDAANGCKVSELFLRRIEEAKQKIIDEFWGIKGDKQ